MGTTIINHDWGSTHVHSYWEKRNTQEKRAPEAQATASTVLLHRRSYKASSVFCGDLVK